MYYEKIEDYALVERLGEGATGSVFLAVNDRVQERFAIKVVPFDALNGMDKLMLHEASIMQSLSHPHLVKLRKFLHDQRNYYLVMDLADGGELFDLIIQSKVFDESTARKYFQQLVSAIVYCHSQKVAHRDLKAENLLLDKSGTLKVCDFGFSFRSLPVPTDHEESQMTYECGTLHYMSPEQLSHNEPVDVFQQDVWAAGVILYFMLAGNLPFDGRDDEETVYLIQNCKCDWSCIPQSAAGFLEGFFVRDALERITLEQVVNHPWFQVDLPSTLFPPETLKKRSSRMFLDFALFDDCNGKLTDGEETIIRQAFERIDVDGDGVITADELRDALIRLKKGSVSPNEVDELMRMFSSNGQAVTIDQFRDAWVKRDLAHCSFTDQEEFQLGKIVSIVNMSVEKQLVKQLRHAFDEIDKSHSGTISRERLREFFASAEVAATTAELNELMNFFGSSLMTQAITFDDFCEGIAKRDVLLKHPLGQKLAKMSDLEPLVRSQELSLCMGSGFTVCGRRETIVDKLVFTSPKIALVTKKQDAKGRDCVYTFRLSIEAGGSHMSPPASTSSRRRGSEPDVSPSKQQTSQSLFDVVLTPTSHDSYVCVKMRRISGPTTDYHEAVTIVTHMLEGERKQAALDSCPHGEPELL